jgi:hypothetical protein
MYCSNLSCKFSRQTQKKLVGFSHYGHFNNKKNKKSNNKVKSKPLELYELAGKNWENGITLRNTAKRSAI